MKPEYIIKQGIYKIIRVNGTEELVLGKPSSKKIMEVIDAEGLDTVILDFKNCQVMMVDDTGLIDGKPENPIATQLYRSVCKPGSKGTIHGDVVLVNDKDF
jgi:hypothetical protein